MTAKHVLLTVAISLAAQSSFGSILQSQPGTKSVEGINVAKTAEADVDGTKTTLTTVGAGLRTKKVVVMTVKVYVAQVLAAEPEKFARTDQGALDSIATQPAAAVQLTFLRSVDAATVQSSFKDALVANKVALNKAEIGAFLSAVSTSGDAQDHKTLTIATSTSAAGDVVVYEGTQGQATTIRGPKGFARDVLSIWLGTPSDDGVAKLKAQLLQEIK